MPFSSITSSANAPPADPAPSSFQTVLGGSVIPRATAAIVASLGTLVLVGWMMGVAELRALGPAGNAATNPTVALCFIGVAASLWTLAERGAHTRWYVAEGLAVVVVSVGILRLASMVFGHAEGIDTIIFHDAMAATHDGRDNRMALGTATNLLLSGTALLLMAQRVSTREALAQVLATIVLASSTVALLAHVYRSGWFETIGYFNRMAVPSAMAFVLLALGTLALRRDSGVLAVVLSDGPGGTLARGLLPAGFLVPAIFGWVAVWGVRNEVQPNKPELVVMLLIMAMILVFVGLIAWNATQVHQTYVERARAQAALRDSELRFRLLAENGSDVVSLHDPSGRICYISPSCERILGFTAHEVTRMGPFALVHPDDRERLRRHFEDLLRGEPVTAIACRMLHKTGRHLWLEMMWRSMTDDDGRVARLQASSRDITERKEYERQLEDARRRLQANQESLVEANQRLAALASQDGLTGLKNRRAFEERMTEELARIRRSGQPVSLLLLDIDHFKAVNDSFGHPRGDEVLRTVARLFSRAIRDSDVAVRFGGEEFAVILPNTGVGGAQDMGERLRLLIASAPWEDRPITVSVGAATAESTSEVTLGELIEQADRALYRSKQAGRNRVTLAEAA
mgnify:CR=1 FL=1